MNDKEKRVLKAMGPCNEGFSCVSAYPSMKEWWNTCIDHPNWMLWYAARKTTRKNIAIVAGKIATDTPIGQGKVLWDIMPKEGKAALIALRGWLDGSVKDEELRKAASAAANAAYAAADAAAYAADANAAADAADAAADAAYAAANAAAYAAYADAYAAYAAYADAYAAYAAANAAADAADAADAKKWQCDIIRELIPYSSIRLIEEAQP